MTVFTEHQQKMQDLTIALSTAYDMQALRIMVGNRLCAAFRAKLNLEPSDPEAAMDEDVKKVIDRIRVDYDLMTDGVLSVTKENGSLNLPRGKFKPVGNITSRGEFALIQQYFALEAQESDHFRNLTHVLVGIPIYDHYLEHVKGIGPALAAVIIRYFDIHKARTPSSFWKYAGLDVVRVEDDKLEQGWRMQGRGQYKTHLVPKTYTNAKGEVTETMGISYNKLLRTKLLGVLAGSFLKCKSPYAEIYYDYVHRLQNHPKYATVQKGHRHRMALRYMIKQFLIDLHVNWRELEGLPYVPSYEEAKLGHVHGGEARRQPITRLVFPDELKKAA